MKVPKHAPCRWAEEVGQFGEGWLVEFRDPGPDASPSVALASRAAELQHAYSSNWRDAARARYQNEVLDSDQSAAHGRARPSLSPDDGDDAGIEPDSLNIRWMADQIDGLSYDMLYAILKGHIWLTQVHIEAIGRVFGRNAEL